MRAIEHCTDLQNRDRGVALMPTMFGLDPSPQKRDADSGYHGPRFQRQPHLVCRRADVDIVSEQIRPSL